MLNVWLSTPKQIDAFMIFEYCQYTKQTLLLEYYREQNCRAVHTRYLMNNCQY